MCPKGLEQQNVFLVAADQEWQDSPKEVDLYCQAMYLQAAIDSSNLFGSNEPIEYQCTFFS